MRRSKRRASPLQTLSVLAVSGLFFFIALAGLVLAKCYDRRWLALYVLSVTVAALCGFILLHMHRMDMSYAISSSIQAYLFARLIPIGAVGLIGTGVALC